jgi:hypothetical protein
MWRTVCIRVDRLQTVTNGTPHLAPDRVPELPSPARRLHRHFSGNLAKWTRGNRLDPETMDPAVQGLSLFRSRRACRDAQPLTSEELSTSAESMSSPQSNQSAPRRRTLFSAHCPRRLGTVPLDRTCHAGGRTTGNFGGTVDVREINVIPAIESISTTKASSVLCSLSQAFRDCPSRQDVSCRGAYNR